MTRFFFPLVLLGALAVASSPAHAAVNNRPIIGVLSEPVSTGAELSYFNAAYVKWLESAGARVVPIVYNWPMERISMLASSLNGLLFTGGGQTLGPETTYYKVTSSLFQQAMQPNAAGEFLPIWGTCQGFQLLSILGAGGNHSVLTSGFESENYPLALELTDKALSSKLFSGVPSDVLQTLTTQNVTQNLHHSGVDPALYTTNDELAAFFDLLSTNKDMAGRPFGSTLESKKFPMFATQWHPERNEFEWDARELVPHTRPAVRAMQWMAEQFVDHCRANSNSFSSADVEEQYMIYQYSPTYTGNSTTQHFPDRQEYFFTFSPDDEE